MIVKQGVQFNAIEVAARLVSVGMSTTCRNIGYVHSVSLMSSNMVLVPVL
jgi:hypothetical protein